MRDTLRITIAGGDEGFGPFAPRVRAFALGLGLSEEAAFKTTLALDELVTNIIAHGYDAPCAHRIDVALTIDEDEVTLRIEDDGRPFNPLDRPGPDTGLHPLRRERPVGGLGVLFARHCMPRARYSREDGRNVLVLSRPRGQGPSACKETCP